MCRLNEIKLVQSAYSLAQKHPQEIRPMRGTNHLCCCVAIFVIFVWSKQELPVPVAAWFKV